MNIPEPREVDIYKFLFSGCDGDIKTFPQFYEALETRMKWEQIQEGRKALGLEVIK